MPTVTCSQSPGLRTIASALWAMWLLAVLFGGNQPTLAQAVAADAATDPTIAGDSQDASTLAQLVVSGQTRPLDTPEDCRSTVVAALQLEKARPVDAIALLDRVIQANKSAYLTQSALYNKARLCSTHDCREEASLAIAVLRQKYPDSPFTTQVGIVDAKLNGRNSAVSEALWRDEQAAGPVFRAGIEAIKRGDRFAAKSIFQTLADAYPQTGAALRAQHRLAYLLDAEGDRDASLAIRQGILQKVGSIASESDLIKQNKLRAANTLYALHRKQEAMALSQELVASSDPSVSIEARIQVAGLLFERLQVKTVQKKIVAAEQWDELRTHCTAVLDSPVALAKWRVRAALMYVESLNWQGKTEQLVQVAPEFLRLYGKPEFKLDVAMIRLCLGTALYDLGRYDEALPHLRAVTAAYADEKTMWGSQENLSRCHYMIWRTLRQSQAAESEIQAAGTALIEQFPTSTYAAVVRATQKKETRP